MSVFLAEHQQPDPSIVALLASPRSACLPEARLGGRQPSPTSLHSSNSTGSLRGTPQTIQQLRRLARRSELLKRFDLETRWLAENRDAYRGKWVALLGNSLVLSADTAKEVFAKVAHLADRPTVIQVDASDTPFAGW